MAPVGTSNTRPHGDLARRIDREFGSYDTMLQQFTKAALERFGSGWAWLGVRGDGSLGITSTPNQGS